MRSLLVRLFSISITQQPAFGNMRILGILFFICSSPAFAQQLNFGNPEALGNAINSEAEETSPLLSSDGKTLYFSRAFDVRNTGGEFAGMDVWVTKRANNTSASPWQQANNNISAWNNKESNAVIGISKDNSAVYLLNAYKSKSGIAFSKYDGTNWNTPELIPIPGINRTQFVGFYMNPDFNVLLISMNQNNGSGQEDLYVCLKDSVTGSWRKPLNLGPTINTEGFEISPFLSADGKRLYFSSNGHGGQGDADIFYSDRLYNSWEAWSTPKNLGPKVNSDGFDAYFSIYGDSVAYFSSNKGAKLANIFQVKVNAVSQFGNSEKQYLPQSEVLELVGMVNSEIRFDKNNITLNSAQNELLFYIANKILTKADIKIQLVAVDDGTSDLVQTRMGVVQDKLSLLGIGSYRIDAFISKTTKIKPEEKGAIKLVFFR